MKAIIILLLSVSAVAQVSSERRAFAARDAVNGASLLTPAVKRNALPARQSGPLERTLQVAMVASAAFDSYTTVRTLSNGCIERNPLMGKRPSTAHIAVFEAGWTAGELVAAHFLRRHHPRIAALFLGESIIEHGVAGGLNTTNRCF